MAITHGSCAWRILVVVSVALGCALAPTPARLWALTFTEIHYNPAPTPTHAPDDLEFVELYNDASVPFDLSGCSFSDGIDFVFPDGSYIQTREFLVVAANAQALLTLFPGRRIIGDFSGRLDNGGESLTLVTRSGSPIAEVTYSHELPWPGAPDGTGRTLSLLTPRADASDPHSWTWSSEDLGTPAQENFAPPFTLDHELLATSGPGTAWRYRKGWNETTLEKQAFSVPSTAWKEPDFDDSNWSLGEAPIGFNDAEIATELADMAGNYDAFAVRRRFTVSPEILARLETITLSIRVDDGCVVFLNGEEVGRIGFLGTPGTEVPFDATPTTTRELRSTPLSIVVPRAKVRQGENLLAAQAHNRPSTAASNDAAFAASATYQTREVPAAPPAMTVVINEVIPRGGLGSSGVELYNVTDMAVSLEGYRLSFGPTGEAAHDFPAGSSIGPRAHRFVAAADLGFDLDGDNLPLFLLAPAPRGPVDAWRIGKPSGVSEPYSHVRFPDGSASAAISTSPTPGASNELPIEDGLVINEIHYNPRLLDREGRPLPDERDGEYIELYNRSSRQQPLEGFALLSGFNYAFPPGTTIPAGGYLVVARSPALTVARYALDPALVVGPPSTATAEELGAFGSLRNRGETVRLVDRLGNTVDEVSYRSGGEWDELADGGGSSLELIDPFQDNSVPMAWAASDETRGAPWVEVSFTGNYVTNLVPAPMEHELHIFLLSSGQCLLDSISVQSGAPAVEHIPNGHFETNTAPWRLIGTHVRSFRDTSEAKVGGACLRLVATGSGDNRVNRIELDTSPSMKAGEFDLKLWARWIEGSNALHISGYNNAFGRTVYLPLPPTTGTPGKENSRRKLLRDATGSDNLGPVITGVSHRPAVPGAQEPVLLVARVSDPDGTSLVEAVYQRDGSAEEGRIELLDDGAHDDGAADDGVYGGELPGFPLRSVVNFTIEARDAGGRLTAFPVLTPERRLSFIVDDKIVGAGLRYRLIANAESLQTPVTGLQRRLLHSDELVRGTFIFDESEVYYDIGFRYRGSPWNRPPDPKMFRIRFPDDKPFHNDVKRVNISRYGTGQSEGTAYHLLHKAGTEATIVPHAPRYEYLNMKFNATPHGASLAEIRPIDSDYARYNWPEDSDGFAWKITGKLAFTDAGQMAGGGPDWSQLKTYATGPYPGDPSSPENYRFYYNNALRVDEDSHEPLIRLLTIMDRARTPDEEYDAKIAELLNVESTLRVYAVRAFLSDWDTVDIGNNQNAYLYYAPIEGRHYLVPWDMDHTFERTDVAIAPAGSTNGLKRLINRPQYKRLYAQVLAELLESSWSEAYIAEWIGLVNQATGPIRVANGTTQVSFLRGRRSTVQTFLRSGQGAEFAVTSPDPLGARGETAMLEGTAGIEVASLYAFVNAGDAAPLAPTWSTPPRQTTAIPTLWTAAVTGLQPGENRVEVLGLDSGGNLVGSKSLAVFNTSGWADPVLQSLAPASGPVSGGTRVTLRGGGFQPGTTVRFGAALASGVELRSPTELAAITPAGGVEGAVDVAVALVDGREAVLPGAFSYGPDQEPAFRRGDVNSSGTINLTDAFDILEFIFRRGPMSCQDAADTDDDGRVTVADSILLFLHLFGGGRAPAPPFEELGPDPTPDGLSCAMAP